MHHFVSQWERARNGDAIARDYVYGQVYTEAHRVAQSRWATEEVVTSEQCRQVLDKVGARLSGDSALEETLGFLAYASSVLRGVLADLARTRRKLKKRSELGELRLHSEALPAEPAADVEVLDHLIDQLQDLDPQVRAIAEMRLYADLSTDDIAEALNQQPEPVARQWDEVRSLLLDALD